MRMSIASLLDHWHSDPDISPNIVEWRIWPEQRAQYTPFPDELHPILVRGLQKIGVQALYFHQAEAWELARAGKNIVIVTGTASGKTLCYHLPVLNSLLVDSQARALYLFPTKALAQDQLAGIQRLMQAGVEAEGGQPKQFAEGMLAAIYDGDTPRKERQRIRHAGRLVLSNPDMLHAGILPHHTAWAVFFRNLQFVVIDEIHVYRGVFGSHVANVIRRLKRVARFYGSTPQFILTSATIANPAELATRLIEEPLRLIDQDGSERGKRHFLIYNPPMVDCEIGFRRGLIQETAKLAEDLLAHHVQSIVFARSRKAVEMLLMRLRGTDLPGGPLKARERVRGYRSGYLPSQRRLVEAGLRSGEVELTVATNALELGIDIGGMGAVLIGGYPGTIAATRQQAGRAGRGASEALAVLVVGANPLDQFLAAHPDYFFGCPPEGALLNPNHPLIVLDHVRCAAFELPFRPGEPFGGLEAESLKEYLEFLEAQGVLYCSGERYFWAADQYPAQGVSLRNASSKRVVLQVSTYGALAFGKNQTIGELDVPSAAWMAHPGAVYLHEAQPYLVSELNLEQQIATLQPFQGEYYTEPLQETTVQLLGHSETVAVKGAWKSHGEILVTSRVIGYRKIRWDTHENLGFGDVSLPPSELATTGYWVALSEDTVAGLQAQGLWSAAPNDYGPEWEAICRRVRERDGYHCQGCGIPERERAHHVHHKIPFRVFATREQANQMQNLITLCPVCHRRAEISVRVRGGLVGLAFTISHLAPLFLMCDRRDLGSYIELRSLLADGKPAVVLYDLVPAGIGFSERLFEIHADLMTAAWEVVRSCQCVDGCPSCVGPPGPAWTLQTEALSDLAMPGGKQETLALLDALVA